MLFLLLVLVFVGVAGLLYGGYLFANRRSLAAKEAALERLRLGKFGTCEDCQQPIGKARLQAMPYARFCIDCARRREQGVESR